MPDLGWLYDSVRHALPLECMDARFMQRALVGLVLLAPMCAAMGVQVVNFRMAFFSDAISHSAFAGVAVGLLLGLDAHVATVLMGLAVGMGIVAVGQRSSLSTDTVIGVFFSAVVAFGLAVVSRDGNVARNLQRFVYGDILTIGDGEILCLAALAAVLAVFQTLGYNRLLYMGLSPELAQVHGVRVQFYRYAFAVLLALVVVFAVWAVGVLLVTALLLVPAAAARNLARSAGAMFWWALAVGFSSAVAGLLVSAQPAVGTATGATVVLCATVWFVASLPAARAGAGKG